MAATRKAPPGGRKQWVLERPRGAAWRWRSRIDPRVTVGYVDGRARRAGRFVEVGGAVRTLRDRSAEDSVQGALLALLGAAGGGFPRATGTRGIDAWAEGAGYEARSTDFGELGDDFAERWRRILEDEEGSTLAEVRARHPGLPTAEDPEGDLMLARSWEAALTERRAARGLKRAGWRLLVSVEVFVYNRTHNPEPEQKVARRRGPGGRIVETRRRRTPVGAVERPGSPYWRPRKRRDRAAGHAAMLLRRFEDRYEGELLGVGLRLRVDRGP